jgi:hypothetical protein
MRARGDSRQGSRRPSASGPRSMMDVGLGAQPQVPKPRRSDEELLSAPRTRELIRSLTTEELNIVHDQGLRGRGRQKWDSPPAQEATETIRLYDTEAENEAVEWLYGEGQTEGEYYDN